MPRDRRCSRCCRSCCSRALEALRGRPPGTPRGAPEEGGRGLDVARRACARRCSGGSSQVFFFTADRRCSRSWSSWWPSSSTSASRRSPPQALSALLGLLSAVSVMASGLLSDRFGYRQTVTASFVGTAAGMAVLVADDVCVLRAACWVCSSSCSACAWACAGRSSRPSSARYFAGPHVATIYGAHLCGQCDRRRLRRADGRRCCTTSPAATAQGSRWPLVFVALAATPFWTVRELRNFR